MKKIFTFIIVLSLVFGMSLMAGTKEFKKGASFITGEFGFNSFAIPFGASYEMAYNENLGIGASFMMQSNSDFYYTISLITPAVFAQYHFTKINVPKLDVAVGASIGYQMYSISDDVIGLTGSSSLFLSALITIRYFITDKLAVSLKETLSFMGDYSGSYTMIGVAYRLK